MTFLNSFFEPVKLILFQKNKQLLVWVDPLDGTKEYTQGYDEAKFVTILIGVAWRGKPIAGVINQPFFKKDADSFLERVLWGIVGLGEINIHILILHFI